MVRELDLSKITLRLVEEVDKKGEGDTEHIKAKLTGDTLSVLRQALVSPFGLNAEVHLLTDLVYSYATHFEGQEWPREQDHSQPQIHPRQDEARSRRVCQ